MIHLLDAAGLIEAQNAVVLWHYLHAPVDVRCMPEGYAVTVAERDVGCFIVGRPQASKCYPWYGSVDDVVAGRAAVTRWQVLNLARVWFSPAVQPGGELHRRGVLPGFTDRHGKFRSTFGSCAIASLADAVVCDYLLRRPPCFLEEPYELRWLLSYCDTRLHRGVIYRSAGFELYRTVDHMQTWRLPLRPLTPLEDAAVRDAATRHPRSIAQRGRRAQTILALADA